MSASQAGSLEQVAVLVVPLVLQQAGSLEQVAVLVVPLVLQQGPRRQPKLQPWWSEDGLGG